MKIAISFLCMLSFACLTYGMEQNITSSEIPSIELPKELIETIAACCERKNMLMRLNRTWKRLCSKRNAINILQRRKLTLNGDEIRYFLNVYAHEGNITIVKNLLHFMRSIDTNYIDDFGMSPLAACDDNLNNVKMINLLSKHGFKRQQQVNMSPLYKAVYYGKIETVRSLIESRKECINKECINEACYKGQTPLMVASALGNYEIVQLLLESGANFKAKDKHDWTALHFVSKMGYIAVIELLLKFGAEIDSACIEGRTPLYLACANNYVDCAQVLLKNNANINATTKTGKTSLYRACESGNSQTVQLLLESGADEQIHSNENISPLAVAYNKGYDNIGKLFIDHYEKKKRLIQKSKKITNS